MASKKALHMGVILSVCLLLLCGCSEKFAKPDQEQVCDPRLFKAYQMLKEKKFAAAAQEFKTHLAQEPDFVDAHTGLGLAYLKTGKPDEAIPEFQTALKIKPGDSQAVLYLGMAYLQKKQFKQAVEVWQKYKTRLLPRVEKEIKRQMTLLMVKINQRSAEKALEREKQLREAGVLAEIDPNVLAVCYYQDLSPDKSLRAFQKGLAAMMITTLSKIESLRVVERLQLQAILEEMALGMTGIVDEKTAPRLGKLLGAGRMVTGALTLGSIGANTNLTLAASGVLEGSQSVSVKRENFFELPGKIAMIIAQIAGIDLSNAERQDIGVPLTTSIDAIIALGLGIDALDAGNYEEAQQHFQAAIGFDPNFQLAVEAAQGVPPPQAPTPRQLKKMTFAKVADTVAAPVNEALEAHNQVDCEFEAEVVEEEPRGVLVEQILEEQEIDEQIEQITSQVEDVSESSREDTTTTLPSFPETPE